MKPWTCDHCGAEQTNERWCEACDQPRAPSAAVLIGVHISEHLADGLSTPQEVLTAMTARPCYRTWTLTLAFIAQQMRLLTVDTTQLARQIAKARASRTMLDVLETGDTKDKLAVLKGIQVLGDVVDHNVNVTSFTVNTHDGPPPKREG